MSECKQAQSHEQLIAELKDSRLPKNEREHAAVREIDALEQRLAAAEARIQKWQTGEPPTDRDSLLLTTYGLMFVGRPRFGTMGEPQQNEFAIRCASSGRFVDQIKGWMPLPDWPGGEK